MLEGLSVALAALVARFDSLETRMLVSPPADQARISAASVSMVSPTSATPVRTAPTPRPTKGKKTAQAAPSPSKAPPAKKEKPTKKKAIPSNPLPLHLAQTFPQEGKPDRHLVTVAIPDASAAHVIGQGGKGLKQVHDISGARISAYTLVEGSRDERHVSIRGTDEQIGDALVVLGKRIARKRIHAPKPKKKTEPTVRELEAALAKTRAEATRVPYGRPSAGYAPAPAPPLQPTVSLHPPPRNDWSTPVSRTPSHGEPPASPGPPYTSPGPPTIVMASPSPLPTPSAPTVAMGSPSPSSSSTPGASLMHIDAAAIHARAMAAGAHIDAERAAAASRPRQTARRGGGPPRGS